MNAFKIEYWSSVGDFAQVMEAIDAGYDVNEVSEDGYTALHAAAENNRVDVVSLLLKYGADPWARVSSGETPSDLAVLSGHVDVVQLLRAAMSRPC